ncbi:MAG: hypothetical protein IPF93_13380 [Saprospiraceae bacterium]|nr:hypothetical protein [Saprospiraceae bacterium]MBK7373573.1 hypothetical protein [Saprospiraceae bacterium]
MENLKDLTQKEVSETEGGNPVLVALGVGILLVESAQYIKEFTDGFFDGLRNSLKNF